MLSDVYGLRSLRFQCGRLLDALENSVWIEGVQSSFGPCRLDILRGERHASCLAIQQSEMLLAYGACASALQLFDSFPIRGLERSEHRHVTWLKLMGRMRGKSTENDIVLMTELQDLEGFMSSESIDDEDSRSTISPWLGLGIKDTTKSLQHNVALAVPARRTSKMPAGCRMGRPITSKGGRGPDDERGQDTCRQQRYIPLPSPACACFPPLHRLKSFLCNRNLRDVRRLSMIPVSCIL